MAPPSFNEFTIRDMATEKSYYRGEDYFESGAVRNLELRGDEYRAYVYGARRYTVEISEEDGELHTSCTCPYDWGGVCKHIVAVMLEILDRSENIKQKECASPSIHGEPVPVDNILASLSADQLRTFVRRQTEEYPEVRENLKIFSHGTSETDRTVEDYESEIVAALEGGDFGDPYADDDYCYDDYREIDDIDGNDTVDDLVEPHRELAAKYVAQGNYVEGSKINEAIVRACGKIAAREGEEVEDAWDETGEFNGGKDGIFDGFVAEECYIQTEQALHRWAEILSTVPWSSDKERMFKRFVGLFKERAGLLRPAAWEKVFQKAVGDRREANTALAILGKDFGKDVDSTGPLLHMLNLTGDTERFVKTGKRAIREFPHLAIPLGEKLLEMSRKKEAVRAVEKALEATTEDTFRPLEPHRTVRESLRRFLIRTYDSQEDYRKLTACATELLLETNDLDDYLFLKNLMTAAGEKEELLRNVTKECEPEAVVGILSYEKRWDDLMAYARSHTNSTEFPQMMTILKEHFPQKCFDLYKRKLWGILDAGTGRGRYRKAASHAQQMREIPGHEDAFAQLMSEVVEKYSRRTSLMEILGDMAELGRAWRDRVHRESVLKLVKKRPGKEQVEAATRNCPVTEKDRDRLQRKRVAWQPGNTRLVWTLLCLHGGKMCAAELTEFIIAERNISKQSAMAIRSIGLKALEVLGYVEVEREGNRLGRIKLIDGSID